MNEGKPRELYIYFTMVVGFCFCSDAVSGGVRVFHAHHANAISNLLFIVDGLFGIEQHTVLHVNVVKWSRVAEKPLRPATGMLQTNNTRLNQCLQLFAIRTFVFVFPVSGEICCLN